MWGGLYSLRFLVVVCDCLQDFFPQSMKSLVFGLFARFTRASHPLFVISLGKSNILFIIDAYKIHVFDYPLSLFFKHWGQCFILVWGGYIFDIWLAHLTQFCLYSIITLKSEKREKTKNFKTPLFGFPLVRIGDIFWLDRAKTLAILQPTFCGA